MKRVGLMLGAALLAGGVTGCYVEDRPARVAHVVTVDRAPPPERVETPSVAPSSRSMWVRGHWYWNGRSWLWVGGHWGVARPGLVYAPGRWQHQGPAWVWVEGSWRRPGT